MMYAHVMVHVCMVFAGDESETGKSYRSVPGIHYLKNILLSGKQNILILLQNQLDLFFVLLFLMVLYLFLAREILFPPISVLPILQLPSTQVS